MFLHSQRMWFIDGSPVWQDLQVSPIAGISRTPLLAFIYVVALPSELCAIGDSIPQCGFHLTRLEVRLSGAECWFAQV